MRKLLLAFIAALLAGCAGIRAPATASRRARRAMR